MKIRREFNAVTGLPSFERPDFADSLVFPANISKIDAPNLADLLGKYTFLYCYTNERRAKAQNDCLRLDSALRLLNSGIFKERPRLAQLQKFQQTVILESDSRWRRITRRLTIAKQDLEMWAAYTNNYDKVCYALTRELGRRSYTGDDERRLDRSKTLALKSRSSWRS